MKQLERVTSFVHGAGERQRVQFTFDGKSYEGLEGDTLAAALLAATTVIGISWSEFGFGLAWVSGPLARRSGEKS